MATKARHCLRLRRLLSTSSIHTISFSIAHPVKKHLVPRTIIPILNAKFHLHRNRHCRNLSDNPRSNNINLKETTASGESPQPQSIILEHQNSEDYYESIKATNKNKEDTNINIDRSEFTEEVPIELPDLGDGNPGKVAKWYHGEGAVIQQGDILCDIETEDVTYSIDIDDECLGILEKRFQVEDGEFINPGTKICMILHKPE